MGIMWVVVSASAVTVVSGLVYRSFPRRREFLVFAFVERIGLPLTDTIHRRIDQRIWHGIIGTGIGSLAALSAYAVILALSPESLPTGVAGFATGGVLLAAMGVSGAVPAIRQFIAPAPGAARFARAKAPTLADYVHPGWVAVAIGLTVVSVGVSAALLADVQPPVSQVGLPLEAILGLAVLAAAGVVVATVLSAKLLSVPQPVSSELELQWDDALRANALRDVWIASLALDTAALVAGFSWLVDSTSPLYYAGVFIGFAPFALLLLPASRRFQSRLWEPASEPAPR